MNYELRIGCRITAISISHTKIVNKEKAKGLIAGPDSMRG